jgi:hypothetical protein
LFLANTPKTTARRRVLFDERTPIVGHRARKALSSRARSRAPSLVVVLAVAIYAPVAGVAAGCTNEDTKEAPTPPRDDDRPALPADLAQRLAFVDGTAAAGLSGAPAQGPLLAIQRMLGGLAATDVDDDGDVDLLLVYPTDHGVRFFDNDGGVFFDVTQARIDQPLLPGAAGALWLDDDGDGDLDLLVTAYASTGARYFRQTGGLWQHEPRPGIDALRYAVSPTAGDVDLDGWLDLFVTHWDLSADTFFGDDDVAHTFLLYGGAEGFVAAAAAAGLTEDTLPFSFAAHFVDVTGDRHPELLVASDFGRSRVLEREAAANDGGVDDGRAGFRRRDAPLTDEHGMGAAVFDADNDGDQDWFVTSIAAPPELAYRPEAVGYSGNRLYRNEGDGAFVDVSASAFVRDGGWGWGACAADFDNDGWVDLFHTNGFEPEEDHLDFFRDDPARLFLNLRDGRFVDVAPHVGIFDPDQGRAVACFDHDDDGDVDIVVMNHLVPPRLWRNEAPRSHHFLKVSLRAPSPNTRAIGATIVVTAGGLTQTKVVFAGNTFLGQQPDQQHFGLGAHDRVDELRILWPDGNETVQHDLVADQHVVVHR